MAKQTKVNPAKTAVQEQKPMTAKQQNKAELVIVVINLGFEEKIVDVTKRLGIGGGTFLNAHGLSKFEAEKFFNVVIEPEKNVALLVVNAKLRNELLKALYEEIGPSTEAQGIVFSLPVDDMSENLKKQLFEKPEQEQDKVRDK